MNSELEDLEKRVAGYSYRLDGGDNKYGLDVSMDDENYEANESEMSLMLPFADGNRRDGVGDLLEISGIDVSRHRANPISLFDHAKSVTLPVGLFSDPKTQAYTVQLDPIAKIAKGKVFVYQGTGIPNSRKEQEYPHAVFCQQIFDLWVKKFIRAGSIGYQVIQASHMQPDYERGTQAGMHLIKILMLEGSVVVMPANQDTVRKSYSDVAREILAMPMVCGKSLSPMLVKSLTPYVKDYNKTIVGFGTGCTSCGGNLSGVTHNVYGKELCSGCYMKTLESGMKSIPVEQTAKIETVPVPRGQDHTKTDIPPAEWEAGLGAKELEVDSNKDLCPNNNKITLSDDYGCPAAYDSQRKGLRACKSCGKNLASVEYLVKEMPVEEIEKYEKALVGTLQKGWGIIYQSKATMVDEVGNVNDGKVKVLLTDGRKFIADPTDYVKKMSGEVKVKALDSPAKFEIGDTVSANGDGGEVVNRVQGANGWAYVVRLSTGRIVNVLESQLTMGKSLYDESHIEGKAMDEPEEKEEETDFWSEMPSEKSMKSIRAKYKFLRTSSKSKSMGDIGEKWMRPDEVLAGGFPQFVVDADDRYKLESYAPRELSAWREAVAKHNSLPSTSAKLKHRKELESAFAELKRMFDRMKSGKKYLPIGTRSLKSIRGKYKQFPNEIRSAAEYVKVGDKLSIFSNQHVVRKVSRNSELPSQIEFELDNGEMVYRNVGDPVYVTMRGKSLGWKSYGKSKEKESKCGTKSLGDIRHKYRTTKGLIRRLRKSASGSSMVLVRSKDMDQIEKEAVDKGLTINRVGSHSKGIEKVKLSGHDGSIDSIAKKYGRMMGKSLEQDEDKTKSVNRNIVNAFYYAAKWSRDKIENAIQELRDMSPADLFHTYEEMANEKPSNRWTADELRRNMANGIRRQHSLARVGVASLKGWKSYKKS